MNLAAVRLTYRLHRFAFLGITVVVAGLGGLAVWYGVQLDGFPEAASCRALLAGPFVDDAAIEACSAYFEVSGSSTWMFGAMAILPVVAGLFLGVPIVAQELDRGTAVLAWSLEPSRRRWLVHRAVPAIVLAIVLGLVAGAAADYLEPRLSAGADPAASFEHYGLRGPVVAGRLVLFLGCGILVGALTGRLLPAMLLAVILGWLGTMAVGAIHTSVLRTEAVVTVIDANAYPEDSLTVDAGARLPSGEDLTWEQLLARYTNAGELGAIQERSAWIAWLIPPERYPMVAAREAIGTAGVGLAAIAATLPLVARRRADPGRVRIPIPRLGRRGRARSRPVGRRAPGFATTARFVLWPHRVELAAGLLIGLAASVGGLVVIGLLTGLSAPAHCIEDRFLVPTPPECATTELFLRIKEEWGGRLFAAMVGLPWILGALVGVVVVGREIEHRTAVLAWSLSPDRRRWLFVRAIVGGLVVILLLAIPSVVASEAQRVVYPWAPPEMSFNDYGFRGHLVVARGVAAFGLALFVGAVLGRVLPALLAAGIGCLGLLMLVMTLLPFGQPSETLPPMDFSRPGPQPLFSHSIPGERLREVELRETIFLGGISLALVAATTLVVERRRPA